MNEDSIVKYIVSCKEESEDARLDREKVWAKCWDAFNCKQDYTKKDDWQSKIFLPKTNTFIEQATSAIKKALVYNPNLKFFSVEGVEEKDKKTAPLIEDLIKFWFKRIDFVSTFTNATRIGFITGYEPVKLFWKKEPVYKLSKQTDGEGVSSISPEKQWDSRLCIVPIDPANIFPDPIIDGTSKPKYKIERNWVDFSDIKKLQEEGIYKNIKEVETDYTDEDYKEQMEKFGIDTSQVNYQPTNTVQDFRTSITTITQKQAINISTLID